MSIAMRVEVGYHLFTNLGGSWDHLSDNINSNLGVEGNSILLAAALQCRMGEMVTSQTLPFQITTCFFS